jgi:hypothetical protein
MENVSLCVMGPECARAALTIDEPSENIAINWPFRADGWWSAILCFHGNQLRSFHTSQGTFITLEWRIHQRLMIWYSVPFCECPEDCPRLFFAPLAQDASRVIHVFAKRALAQLGYTLSDNVLNCLHGLLPCTYFVYEL